MIALSLRDVVKSFGERRILHSLDLKIETGEVYGLLGPNGAGKSTTVKIICHLAKPDAGEVRVFGDPPSERTKYSIGVALQEICLYEKLTCGENLRFTAALYDLRGAELEASVERSLAAVKLTDRRDSVVDTLSGGMKRRLHVALALVHRPRLVILDEPTEGMDIESRRAMWAIVGELRKQEVAVLLTTHNVEEAQTLCDRIGILREGQIAAEGRPLELVRRVPARQVVLVRGVDEAAILERLRSRGLEHRRTELGVHAWLRDPLELSQVVRIFDGIALDALSQRPVSVEDVYMEVIHGVSTTS